MYRSSSIDFACIRDAPLHHSRRCICVYEINLFGKRCFKFGVVYGWSDSLILRKLSVLVKSLWNESVGVATLAHKLGLGRHAADQGSCGHSAGFGSFAFDLNSHMHMQISIELKGIKGAYLWWEESCYERNMLIVDRKHQISSQIILNRRQICLL